MDRFANTNDGYNDDHYIENAISTRMRWTLLARVGLPFAQHDPSGRISCNQKF